MTKYVVILHFYRDRYLLHKMLLKITKQLFIFVVISQVIENFSITFLMNHQIINHGNSLDYNTHAIL